MFSSNQSLQSRRLYIGTFCSTRSFHRSTIGANNNMPTASNNRAGVVLDGSTGEGGGQILRNAISYATILQTPLAIDKIRARRTKPGLRAQHIASLQLPVHIAGGKLKGDTLHSSEITYTPPEKEGLAVSHDESKNIITQDIGTAGSICLLLQAALPVALFQHAANNSPIHLKLLGGTNATLAPQYDYWQHVFIPILTQQCGIPADTIQPTVVKRGYFPRGGGQVDVCIQPLTSQPLQSIHLVDRGNVNHLYIRSFHAGKLPRHLAESMAIAAQSFLKQQDGLCVPFIDVDIVTEHNAVGNGLGILLVATTATGCKLASSALCGPKQRVQDVGRDAAKELWQTLKEGGCVDEYLQDQLILYMALAKGTSEILTGCMTLHTRTAIWVAEQFLSGVKFQVQRLKSSNGAGSATTPTHEWKGTEVYGKEGRITGQHLIRCTGVGLVAEK